MRELREHLADHPQKVAGGVTVAVMSRGDPVAKLVPYLKAARRRLGFLKERIAFNEGWP